MSQTLADQETQLILKPYTVRVITKEDDFFQLLPELWKDCLLPYWDDYRDATHILGIYKEDELLGGGLIFTKPAPDTSPYLEYANSLFARGYLYIGFLWINEQHRRKGLGKEWLEGARMLFPENRFWLAIEEEDLKPFYNQNGFSHAKTIHHSDDCVDWIFLETSR